MGNDPQSARSAVEMDLRYSLGRGEHWLYAYAVWSHKPGALSMSVGEARYCIKLNPEVFDYMTVDADRRRVMPTPYDWEHGAPLNLKEARRMTTGIHKGEAEHKYDYSAVLSETPAYGWSSTKSHVGLWMVNPSMEYIGGGPTKAELTGHLDVNPGALPTLLNMWLGSHYGGTALYVGEQESWTKVIGPFLIYCNSSGDHEAMWKDALERAGKEAELWPYAWISDPDYVPAARRASVHGRIRHFPPRADGDIEVAARVTDALGIEHVVLDQSRSRVAAELTKNVRTSFCADEHAWMLTLADYLGGHTATVYDGLGGDFLSRGSYQDRRKSALFAAGDFSRLADNCLDHFLAGQVSEESLRLLLQPDAYRRFDRTHARERVARELERHADAANPMTSFVFWNRCRREISLYPYALSAADHQSVQPVPRSRRV